MKKKSLDVKYVVGISRIYYYRKAEGNPSGVNLKLPLDFQREEVECCDEVILDSPSEVEWGNSASEFSRFYAIVMEVRMDMDTISLLLNIHTPSTIVIR